MLSFSTHRKTAKRHQHHKTLTTSCDDDRLPQLASKISESTQNTREEQQHQESEKFAKSIFETKHANDTEYQKYHKYEEYLAKCSKNRNDANSANSHTSVAKQQLKSFNSSAVPFSISSFKSNFVEQRKSPARDGVEMDEMNDRNEKSIKENFSLIYKLLNPINYDNPKQNAEPMELVTDNYLHCEDHYGKKEIVERMVIFFLLDFSVHLKIAF